MPICPCCGSEVDPSKLLIDLDANVVAMNGKIARARAQVVEFLYLLNNKYPATARFDEALQAVYGQGDRPIEPQKSLYTLVFEARQIGIKLGFSIEGNYKRG